MINPLHTGAARPLGIAIGASLVALHYSNLRNDFGTQYAGESSVAVDSAVDPFPTFLSSPFLHAKYRLLGHGVRSVTFLGFKVYGIGLYIDQKSQPVVLRVIRAATAEKDLQTIMKDPETSANVINQLLDEHINYTVRISPVRNTDFGHLRDGLVKSVLASSVAKANKETVGEGLEQLRAVFQGHKGSVPKNHVLWLEYHQDRLFVTYENTKSGEIRPMGQVSNSMVGRVLLLQYLHGQKPLSAPLRDSCVENLQ